MTSISLKVKRPPAGDAGEAHPDSAKPLFRGTGDTDYLCGNCGAVIALGIGPTQRVPFHSAVCSACGAENELPPSLGS
jgi:DNA-directed RNA polymerase subunit RPC12/RpoP